MGTIALFGQLYGDNIKITQPIAVTPPEVTFQGIPLLEDAREITLAEYARETKDIITAHKMKDYRRKQFNLVLLPKIEVMFNRILEGSDYWRALLHDESPYT